MQKTTDGSHYDHAEHIRLNMPSEIGQKSVVIGDFDYPEQDKMDDGDYADACSDREQAVRTLTLEFLNEQGVATADVEIRLSEYTPGEIRAYGL